MWDQVNKLPPILVGQSILNYLDFKSLVRFETALVNSERKETLRSFLLYTSEIYVEAHIPSQMAKLGWLQAHDLVINKAIVLLDKVTATFNTKMVNEIVLVDNNCVITNATLSYLPDTCYEKVVSIDFTANQDDSIMEELFSRLHNLREFNVGCSPNGWIKHALKGLHRDTNHNIIIERINMCLIDMNIFSVAEIAKFCPRLQTLDVHFNISEDSLIALSTYCPLLKKLRVTSIPRISTEQNATLCAPALSCIHYTATPYEWVPVGLRHNDVSQYAMAVPYLTELRGLNVMGHLDHVLLPLISQYCLKLESIDIDEICSATTAQLLQFTENCKQLKDIHLTCYEIYFEEFVVGLIQRSLNLQKLTIFIQGIDIILTDDILLALSEHCLHLEKLEVYGPLQITEAAVLQLVQQCKHLHTLALPDTYKFYDTVFGVPVEVKMEHGKTVYYFDRKL